MLEPRGADGLQLSPTCWSCVCSKSFCNTSVTDWPPLFWVQSLSPCPIGPLDEGMIHYLGTLDEGMIHYLGTLDEGMIHYLGTLLSWQQTIT